jgi:hypothetical protein
MGSRKAGRGRTVDDFGAAITAAELDGAVD